MKAERLIGETGESRASFFKSNSQIVMIIRDGKVIQFEQMIPSCCIEGTDGDGI